MKIVISDYTDTLNRNLEYEKKLLTDAIPNCEVVIYPYKNKESLIKVLSDADGLITAFLEIDNSILSKCPKLKCISINATGYDTINLNDAREHNVSVCAIKEYCTIEVAEFTMALLLSLSKKIKMHQNNIEEKKIWQYELVGSVLRLENKTLAIYGLGKIGQEVAKRALAFNMNVVAVDPYIPQSIADKLGVKLVDNNYVFKHADIISNHMNVLKDNTKYFNHDYFSKLEKRPIFINVGRGICVDESALIYALDNNLISSAGLDVLSDESPNISTNPLFNRPNVIITPHAAFYSDESSKLLQEISCNNLINFFNNDLNNINHIVSL